MVTVENASNCVEPQYVPAIRTLQRPNCPTRTAKPVIIKECRGYASTALTTEAPQKLVEHSLHRLLIRLCSAVYNESIESGSDVGAQFIFISVFFEFA